MPAPCEEAVELVGDAGDEEDPARRPARAVRLDEDDHEERDQSEPQDRERVRKLRERCRDGAGGHWLEDSPRAALVLVGCGRREAHDELSDVARDRAPRPHCEEPERDQEQDTTEGERAPDPEVEPQRGDAGDRAGDDRVDHGDDAWDREERLQGRHRRSSRNQRLEDALLVVVRAGDEVRLQLRRELEVGVPDPVHPLHPDRVLVVDLPQPRESRDAEEVDDGQEHECEGDEAGAEVGGLADERERDHGAGQRSDEDRGAAHRLGVAEAAGGQQAPVLRRQDLERMRAARPPGPPGCVGTTRAV